MKITLRVTYNDGSSAVAATTAGDIIDWEEFTSRSVLELQANLRFTDLCWLSWKALQRDGKTGLEFRPWVDTIAEVEVTEVEASPVPLESTASTSA